jgi:hypothetical protein
MTWRSYIPQHCSPQDRGSSDAYYQRPYDPHYITDNGKGIWIEEADMTPEQIEEYKYGYENETERKDWG